MPYGQLQVDTVKDSLNNVLAPASAVFRNRIINGAMVVAQYGTGSTSVQTTSSYVSCDRFTLNASQNSKFTIQQNAGSVTPPVGFGNYLGMTSSSAYAITATDYFLVSQKIEGFNFSDMAWGTANAKTVTLSFQVYSSLTGTFGGCLRNSAVNRYYPFSYTISSANTWTPISVTIAGDTTGTWVGATNGTGVEVMWSLGTGSTYSQTAGSWTASTGLSATGATSVVGTSGATFYITGVQLEVGTNASNFDYRNYGIELIMCQRYCRSLTSDGGADKAMFSGVAYQTNTIIASYTFPTMRVAPTATVSSSTLIDVVTSTVTSTNNTFAVSELTPNSAQIAVTNSGTPFTAGNGAVIRSDGMSLILSSEL